MVEAKGNYPLLKKGLLHGFEAATRQLVHIKGTERHVPRVLGERRGGKKKIYALWRNSIKKGL